MASDRFCLLADAAFRWFLIGPGPPHVAEGALALHLFLEHPQGTIDVVVAYEDLHDPLPFRRPSRSWEKGSPRVG